MADQKLLAVFEVTMNGSPKRFSIYGDYEVETGQDYNNKDYNYPEFYDLVAKSVENGKETDYQPTGTTWAGRKYVVADMIQSYIASLIHGGTLYNKIYLDDGLQKLVDFYNTEEKIATTVNGVNIPKWILDNSMNIYELILVTNEFIYYCFYDEYYMLRTSNHEVVSDNYFAEVGYMESIENIAKGTEELIWGELPSED